MWHLTLSRLAQTLIALFLISALTFALLAAAGGDALSELRADSRVNEEALNNLRHIYQLDQPLSIRYGRWLTRLITEGDAGYSISFQAPVWQIVWPRFLMTLTLAAIALVLSALMAFFSATFSAMYPGSIFDRCCAAIIFLASTTPRLLIALVVLACLPAFLAAPSGLTTGAPVNENSSFYFLRLFPPALVLSVPLIAIFTAQLRDALRDALHLDFVRVARAKGLPERTIVWRHALRAALNPFITIAGYSLGGVMGGSVIVESVLGWQGLGQLCVTAVRSRDVPLLLGVVLIVSAAVLAGNLLADILLSLNDPRIRSVNRNRSEQS